MRDVEHGIYQFVQESKDWNRLKNILLQERDGIEKDWKSLDVYTRARRDLRAKLQQLLSLQRKQDVEEWIQSILQRSPNSVSNFKLGLNRIWKPTVRESIWKAKFQNTFTEFHPNPIPFDKIIAFFEQRPYLGNIELYYPKLQKISSFVHLSDLELSVSIGLALCLSGFDGSVARMDSMYLDSIYLLGPVLKDPQFVFKVTRNVQELLETLEPTMSKDTTDLVEKLIKNVFVDHVSLPVIEFIFDQLLLFSAEACDDPTMPSMLKWVSWISFVLLVLVQDRQHFYQKLHKITKQELSVQLEKYFVSHKREQLINEAKIPVISDDQVVEIHQNDFKYEKIPTYHQELLIWKRKQAAIRKERVSINLKKWRTKARYCAFWIYFLKTVKKNPIERHREITKVEEIVHVKEKTSSARKNTLKKSRQQLALEKESGLIELNPFGQLFEALLNSSRLIFDEPPLTPLDQSELQLFFPTSPKLKPTSPGPTVNREVFKAMFDAVEIGTFC